MFLARYKDKMVIGNDDGYTPINFGWDTFSWPSELIEHEIKIQKLKNKLNQHPVHKNGKIICVGRNYEEHINEEMKYQKNHFFSGSRIVHC